VILNRKGKQKEYYRGVRVWTNISPPVVTEVDDVSIGQDKSRLEGKIRLWDFQKCPGGMVARKVRLVDNLGPRGMAQVADWSSEDLGVASPSTSDFVLEVDKNIRISGLGIAPPLVDGKRRLDITTLREEDVTGRVHTTR
jgi:hypothetical protein